MGEDLSSNFAISSKRNFRLREPAVERRQKTGCALGDVNLEDIGGKGQACLWTRRDREMGNRDQRRRDLQQRRIFDRQPRQRVDDLHVRSGFRCLGKGCDLRR